MTIAGRIHSIETLGTVDGPGIRTVIFLQGCPLRCRYCHNPDSWDPLAGRKMNVEDIFSQVMRYRPYHTASGGGVTLSGGEPGLQPGFAAALLKRLQEDGVHSALDTSGQMEPEAAESMLNHTDLVILDIKHMNETSYQDLTGRNLSKTLDFARLVSKKKIPLWVRQVLLPGWTDAPAQLQALAAFCSSLETLERLELLPYHRLGAHKWQTLGMSYSLENVHPPTEAEFGKAMQILRQTLPEHILENYKKSS